mgnify:CR=1 FL=1
MAFRNNTYRPGIGAVGAYQMGAIPYITGSAALANGDEHTITFPTVTRHITVINHSSGVMRVHFASTSGTNVAGGLHFIELDSDEDSISMSVRLTTLYISNASGVVADLEYRVIAELTPISTDDNPALGTVGISE